MKPVHALAALFAAVTMADAQADYDGRYRARIACDAIPGATTVPLDTALTLSIANGEATYSRQVLQPSSREPSGVVERGTGRVGANGELTLTGSATGANWTYEASYAGRIDSGVAKLAGRQSWRFRAATVHERRCTIEARLGD